MEFMQKFATVGQYTFRYIDEGSGPAVVLIHGLAGDFSAWLAQIEVLRHAYRVIAFDNRGAGQSTQVDEPVSTADLARDTLGLMDYLQIAKAHVVGRSMGGAVAQWRSTWRCWHRSGSCQWCCAPRLRGLIRLGGAYCSTCATRLSGA